MHKNILKATFSVSRSNTLYLSNALISSVTLPKIPNLTVLSFASIISKGLLFIKSVADEVYLQSAARINIFLILPLVSN